MVKPCLSCGNLAESSRCEPCRIAHERPRHRANDRARNRSTTARGYDTQWRRLSERARKAQPWCSDCGSKERLTADHLPIAWERREAGKSVRLCDVEVVCSDCNSRRGSSRPGTARAAS